MKTFSYHMPTRVVLERGAIDRLGELMPRVTNVTVVTGLSFARRTGLCDRLENILQRASATRVTFATAPPNPTVSDVEAVAQVARENGAELMIGLGGGSAMDAAKAAAVLVTNRKPLVELFPVHEFEHDPIPLICIPTTAGTGSETTQYAIINNDENTDKLNLNSPRTFPVLALLDPELGVSMPKEITADTGLDALSHAIEGYISCRSQPISDCLALESIRGVRENLPVAVREGGNLDARAGMLYAAAAAGMVIAQTGTTALHAFGYYLTLHYGVPHGRANGALLGHYLRLIEEACPEKTKELYSVFGAQDSGYAVFLDFAESLGVSTSLRSYGVKEDAFDSFRNYVMTRSSVRQTPGDLKAENVEKLLVGALG